MSSLKKSAFLLVSIVFTSAIFAQTTGVYYYSQGGKMNVTAQWKTWSGTAWSDATTLPNLTNGTAIIDKNPTVTVTGQQDIGASMYVDTWNNSSSYLWHAFYGANNYSVKVNDFVQTGASFQLRSAGASANSTFEATNKVDIQTGKVYFGSGTTTGTITDTYALRSFTAKDVLMASGTDMTLGVSQAVTITNLKIGTSASSLATRFYALNNRETSSDTFGKLEVKITSLDILANKAVGAYFGNSTNALKLLEIGTINLKGMGSSGSDSTINIFTSNYDSELGTGLKKINKIVVSEAGAADIYFNGTLTNIYIGTIEVDSTNPLANTPYLSLSGALVENYNIDKVYLKDSGSKYMNLAFRQSAAVNITDFVAADTSLTDSSVRFTAGNDAKLVNITNITNESGSQGGILLANSTNIASEKFTVIGETSVFNVKADVTNVSSFGIADKLSVTGGATVNFGDSSKTLKSFTVKDVDILGGSKNSIYSKQINHTGLLTISGTDSQAIWTVGADVDTTPAASFNTIDLGDGATFNLFAESAATSSVVIAGKFTAVLGSTFAFGASNALNLKSLTINDFDISTGSLSNIYAKQVNQTGLLSLSGAGTQLVFTVGTDVDTTAAATFDKINLATGTTLKISNSANAVSSVVITDKLTALAGSSLTIGAANSNNLKSLTIKDVDISTGNIVNIFARNLVHTGTIDVHGAGTETDWYIGNTSEGITGTFATVNVYDSGYFYLRRGGSEPNHTIDTLNVTSTNSGQTKVTVGASTSYESGSIAITNLNFKAASTTDGVADKNYSYVSMYLLNGAVGSENINITNAALEENAFAYIDFRGNAKIGSLTAGKASKFSVRSPNYTVTVGGNFASDANELAVIGATTLNVKGNFTNTRYYTDGNTTRGLSLNLTKEAVAGSFVVDGYFENKGVVFLNGGESTSDLSVSFGGLRGISGDGNTRFTTNSGYVGGIVTMNLTGDGNYVYVNRIHDYSQGAKEVPANLTGAVSINKTGSGRQVLSGINYFRGDTTVSAGELYMKADGKNNDAKKGIGALILKGGKFGAVGSANVETAQILSSGTVIAENLTWSSAASIVVFVDASGLTNSFLDLVGLIKDTTDSEGAKYVFEFEFLDTSVAILDSYKIAEVDSITGFTENDFAFTTNNENLVNRQFKIESGALYLVTQIPEPSTYAAIFGLAMFAFVAYRRRQKK